MKRRIDVQLYNAVTTQPEALPYKFYRKALAAYVTNMPLKESQREAKPLLYN